MALVNNYATETYYSSPAVANGYVYVGTQEDLDINGTPGGLVYQLNATNLSLVNSYDSGNVVWSAPAVAYGYVYIVGGTGSYGSFGGMSVGIGTAVGGSRKEPPQIAEGANRFTVQPLGSTERIEVMSYEKYKAGDCVKVLAGHPTEFPRFFALKPGERCE